MSIHRKNKRETKWSFQVSIRKLFQSSPILGYIGAQTGSLIIQAAIAAGVGIAVAVKLYWHKIAKLFSRNKGEAESAELPAEQCSEEGLSDLEASLLPESGTGESSLTMSSTSEAGIEE